MAWQTMQEGNTHRETQAREQVPSIDTVGTGPPGMEKPAAPLKGAAAPAAPLMAEAGGRSSLGPRSTNYGCPAVDFLGGMCVDPRIFPTIIFEVRFWDAKKGKKRCAYWIISDDS